MTTKEFEAVAALAKQSKNDDIRLITRVQADMKSSQFVRDLDVFNTTTGRRINKNDILFGKIWIEKSLFSKKLYMAYLFTQDSFYNYSSHGGDGLVVFKYSEIESAKRMRNDSMRIHFIMKDGTECKIRVLNGTLVAFLLEEILKNEPKSAPTAEAKKQAKKLLNVYDPDYDLFADDDISWDDDDEILDLFEDSEPGKAKKAEATKKPTPAKKPAPAKRPEPAKKPAPVKKAEPVKKPEPVKKLSPLELGKEYEEKQQFEQAVAAYEQGYKAGDGECALRLAQMYFYGREIEHDYEKAGEYADFAKKTGNVEASRIAYRSAERLMKEKLYNNPQNAVNYLPEAAYEYAAELIDNNDKVGLDILEVLAEDGFGPAQYEMGRSYLIGRFVRQDDYEAIKWYQKAGESHEYDANVMVSKLYLLSHDVPSSPVKAYEAALKAMEGEEPGCYMWMGYLYHKGEIVNQDVVKAEKLYLKGANEQNDPEAMYWLAELYMGERTMFSTVEAHKWLQKSSDLGYEKATRWLHQFD